MYVCCISSLAFAFFYSHWCMEIKCDGTSKTSRSTKKNGQDGCEVREKNNSYVFFLSFLPTSLLSFFFARMELFHQMMLMRYCSCLECPRSIPIIDMNSMNKKRERENLYYNVSHEF